MYPTFLFIVLVFYIFALVFSYFEQYRSEIEKLKDQNNLLVAEKKQLEIQVAIFKEKIEIENCLERAKQFEFLGNYDLAIRYYENILKVDKNFIKAYFGLSHVYELKEEEESRDYTHAIIDLLRKAETIDPNEVLYSLAERLEKIGEFDESLSYYKKALELENDPFFQKNLHLQIAKLLLAQKKYVPALNSYDIALECSIKENGDDSDCSEIYAFKREIYSLLGDADKIMEMDAKFISAEGAHVRRPKRKINSRLGRLFKPVQQAFKKMEKGRKARSEYLFQSIQSVLVDTWPNGGVEYRKIEELVDLALDEFGFEGGELRMIEKAKLMSRLT